MSNERIKELLEELSRELETTGVNAETVQLAQKLDEDLKSVIDSSGDASADNLSLVEQAKQLEVKFATNHPAAERMMQEVVDILSKMGI